MKKMKAVSRTIWVAIVVIIIIIAGVAVYWWYTMPPAEEEVERKISIAWTEGPEFDYIEDRISEFETEYDIEVEFLRIPRAHIIERLMLEILAPTGKIDGTVLYILEAPTLAGTGGLVNLYDYKAKSEWIADTFYEGQLEILEFDGELYFLPTLWNGALLTYYRSDLFADTALKAAFNATYGYELEPPDTPDKLLDVAEFFHDQGYIGIHLQLTTAEMGAGAYTIYPGLAHHFGGGIYDDATGEITCNSTESVEALEYLIELAQYAQEDVLTDGTFEAELAVMQWTDLAMADQWSYMIPMLPDAAAEWSISVRPFPQGPDMLGIAILNTSPKKDLVWEFVKWTSSFDIVKGTTLVTPKAAGRADVATDPEVASQPWVDVLLDSYGRVHPIAPIVKDPRAVEIYEMMMLRLGQALTGAKTAKEALDALYEDIDAILQY
ncbi:extracellular solute-binding protein [Candidatus Bathyarchaeota archaeon]|nr:extracellular solute-binding protein [Candidatus Bathyarchaeota archaeon]